MPTETPGRDGGDLWIPVAGLPMRPYVLKVDGVRAPLRRGSGGRSLFASRGAS